MYIGITIMHAPRHGHVPTGESYMEMHIKQVMYIGTKLNLQGKLFAVHTSFHFNSQLFFEKICHGKFLGRNLLLQPIL